MNEWAQEINSGKRKAIKFAKEQEIAAGDFFILNGIKTTHKRLTPTLLKNLFPLIN